ncbi:nitronate monooxygenase [Ammoniphilus sp. 3BR4]|uniref:nitronate monooxygenase n=1 Tax=Ammoniphilus sp. 3BR4 TaxID=3158265 RepID=UPI0034653EF8
MSLWKTTTESQAYSASNIPLFKQPWITDAKMVAAVSNAGGMGVLGPHGGYNTVPTGGVAEVGERLRHEIRKIKGLTDKPFAVNLFMPKEGWDKYSRTTLEVALGKAPKAQQLNRPVQLIE